MRRRASISLAVTGSDELRGVEAALSKATTATLLTSDLHADALLIRFQRLTYNTPDTQEPTPTSNPSQ